MNCSCSSAIENHFDGEHAQSELERYLKKGPFPSARLMLDMLRRENLDRSTMLDIGSGIGVLELELAQHLRHATLVEISRSYLAVAESEAGKRGHADRITMILGDFLERVDDVPEADLVVLDRVICCYPDFMRLIDASSQKCRHRYLISYPHNRWYLKLDTLYRNWKRRRKGNPFQTYVHPPDEMRRALTTAGFRRSAARNTLIWRVEAYQRISS